MPPHILISGGGVAGPALAAQLVDSGWRATVVERFPRLRREGHNIDIRGPAKEVAEQMGIMTEIRSANTGETGMRLVEEDGSTVAAFPTGAFGSSDGPTAELEILRGALCEILVNASKGRAEYRFSTQIEDLTDAGDHVVAVLSDASTVEADLVVIAEGLRSRSRVFVTNARVEELGMYYAYLTIDHVDSDDTWWRWQRATRSRAAHLRPNPLGGTNAILTFLSETRGLEKLALADQAHILRSTFEDMGGLCPRILKALDEGVGFYFDAAGKFSAPRWSKGRVALLGDAAFSNATFGGAGTSLALIGAHVLASELSHGDDHLTALARYEKAMRAFTDSAPRVSARMLRLAHPRTQRGINTLHTAARLAASPLGRAATGFVNRRGGRKHQNTPALPAPAGKTEPTIPA